MYQPRIYRHWVRETDLISYSASIMETDLCILTVSNLKTNALKSIKRHRNSLEQYIESHPLFLTSLEPIPVAQDAPVIVKDMAKAAEAVGVGPMAAVAGAIAEAVGKDLQADSAEVIVENGGDIFLKSNKRRLIGIYAGSSPFTGKIALEVDPHDTSLGICTSSKTVGHSLSFGEADAVIVLSQSTSLADAAATAIGNRVKTNEDISAEIEKSQAIEGLMGVVIIKSDNIGLWGDVKLADL
jgi:ApbE superfamily uncharacterized protein (UPF0280 family)